jgi:hypothetical protein
MKLGFNITRHYTQSKKATTCGVKADALALPSIQSTPLIYSFL